MVVFHGTNVAFHCRFASVTIFPLVIPSTYPTPHFVCLLREPSPGPRRHLHLLLLHLLHIRLRLHGVFFLLFAVTVRDLWRVKLESVVDNIHRLKLSDKHRHLIQSDVWDNLWESRGGSMVNGAPREFPESTQCTP